MKMVEKEGSYDAEENEWLPHVCPELLERTRGY